MGVNRNRIKSFLAIPIHIFMNKLLHIRLKNDTIYELEFLKFASVAELVDAVDSKSTGGNSMPVRLRPLVPLIKFNRDIPF